MTIFASHIWINSTDVLMSLWFLEQLRMISDACIKCIKILAHFVSSFCLILASPFVGKLPHGWSTKSNNSIFFCILAHFSWRRKWQEYTHTHAFYSDSIVIRILYYTQFVYLYTSIHMCVSHTHDYVFIILCGVGVAKCQMKGTNAVHMQMKGTLPWLSWPSHQERQ